MYSIYANDTCIYSDRYLPKDWCAIDPVLTMEDNAAGTLELTLPPQNVGYNLIERMKTEMVVKKDGEEIWSGRVLSEDSDFLNRRTVYCEGELAYLNDTTQPQAEYHNITVRDFLKTLMAVHNSKVSADKRFEVGVVTVTDSNDSLYRYTNYEKTIECINEKLIDRLGGHIRIRKENGIRYIDYLKDYPTTSSQVIRFGKNLLDFTKSFDMSELATVILPLGASTEEAPKNSNGEDMDVLQGYLDVSSVNNGSIYVVSTEAKQTYGWIEKVVHWDDVTEAKNLLAKAKKYLESIQFEEMQLEVSAMDLNYIDVNTEHIKLLDRVRVISKPHGLDSMFPVTKLTIPLDKPQAAKFELGTKVRTSLTKVNNATNAEILNRIDNMPTESSILKSAREDASALIQNATSGYVTIIQGDDQTQEILITDHPDYTKAEHVWRWNINGLGYSSDGYNGTYGLAMTMNGAIVADFVTAGTMYADRIKGGTLTLGGFDNENGVFVLQSKDGRPTIIMSNNGCKMVAQNGYYMNLNTNGQITGGKYNGNSKKLEELKDDNNYEEYGIFDASAVGWDEDYTPAKEMHGFRIKTDYLNIVTSHLSTTDSMSDDAGSTWTFTGDIPYIKNVKDLGDGRLQFEHGTLGVLNGLITHL